MVGAPTRLRLRVAPGATRPGVVGRHGGAWKVRVAQAPERGRANDAVVALVAETLGVPRADVTLVTGHGSRDKVLEVDGMDTDEIDRRLAAAVGE